MPDWFTWVWWLCAAVNLGLVVYNALLCRRWIVLCEVYEQLVSGAWHNRMWLARLTQAYREADQAARREARN